MSERPTVTVAICTRNRPDVLEACLRTVDFLDPAPNAVVVIDQSDPETAGKVRELCDARIAYVRSEPRGLGYARELALERCDTEILLFTDDDCLVRPGWAGALAAVFSLHPRAGAAVGAVRPHPAHPLPEGVPGWVTDWGGPETRVYVEPTDPARIGGGLNFGVRVPVLLGLGGFDPELGAGAPLRSSEDADAFHRILSAGWQVVYTPQAVVSHRPPRDLAAHEANEQAYAWGLGAWAAKRLATGDRLPRLWWRDALRRTLLRAIRCAPFDGVRPTMQRLRVAVHLVRGWREGRKRFGDGRS